MKTVHKYEINISETTTLELPPEAKVVHFGIQKQYRPDSHQKCEVLFAWIEKPLHTDPEDFVTKALTVVGTGFEIPDNYTHRGTTITEHGFVWHLYEKNK